MARVIGIGGVSSGKRPKGAIRLVRGTLGISRADYGGANFVWSDEVPATMG